MSIRAAEARDSQRVAELWCHAFPGHATHRARLRQLQEGGAYGGLESVRVLEDGDRLLGACKLYALTQYVTGRPVSMLGLAAVGVAPDARRRGVGRRLCLDALTRARERGHAVSVLFPFRSGYYRRLGWGHFGALHAYDIAPAALPEDDAAGAVRLATPADRGAIAACYARIAARSNGPIERDDDVWSYRIAEGEIGVISDGSVDDDPDPHRLSHALVHDDGGVRGYALVRYAPEHARRPALRVRELLAEDDVAYRGLIGWLGRQRDQWPRVHYDARPAERLDALLRDPRAPGGRAARPLWFETARLLRGPMLRIVDAERALAARRWWGAPPDGAGRVPTGAGAAIRVEIDDAQLPDNRGPWRMELDGGEAAVTADDGRPVSAALATDAAGYARLHIGELRPSDAVRAGRARVEGDAALLDRIFAVHEPPWLLDHF